MYSNELEVFRPEMLGSYFGIALFALEIQKIVPTIYYAS